MGINKVVYGGKTLIDLTGDTVTADKLLEGVTAHGKDGEVVTGACTFDVDSNDANAAVAEVLKGKTAYARGTKIVGTMPNNGAVTGTIKTLTESYVITQGYHDGSGTVTIDSAEQAKLVAKNIREGITILGVKGSYEAASSGGSSENNCEAYLVDVLNPTVSFKKASGTIKAYGYAYATTKQSWGSETTTVYAFNGTNYYKSATYGSPTATNITLGISDGKLTGLPSGLSGGSLLVTRGI